MSRQSPADPDPGPLADLETETEEGPDLAGQLPRFQPSTPRTQSPPPGPPQPPGTDPAGPAAPDRPDRSSPASTDPPARPKEPPVDPKDLRDAVRHATDIAFVLVGQAFGVIEARARRKEQVDPKWVPSLKERELIMGPAGRIAKRHIHADKTAADTIDGCMIAAGVGAFACRGFFGIEPLGADHDDG